MAKGVRLETVEKYQHALNELNNFIKDHNSVGEHQEYIHIARKHGVNSGIFYIAVRLGFFFKADNGAYKSHTAYISALDAKRVVQEQHEYQNKRRSDMKQKKAKTPISPITEKIKFGEPKTEKPKEICKIDENMPVEKKIELLRKMGIKGRFTIDINI